MNPLKTLTFLVVSFFIFGSSFSSASETNGCIEEIATATTQLALTKAELLLLIEAMKKLDEAFKEEADALDIRVMSTLDEGSNLVKSTSSMQKATTSVTTLVNTEGIVAKARLIYLKAAILRFQFHASKLTDEEIEEFNQFRKNNK